MSLFRQILVPFLIGAGAFFLLRELRVPGGDTDNILGDDWSYFWGKALVYNIREAFSTSLMQITNWYVRDLTLTFSIWSALFGGAYLTLLWNISRDWRFLAANLCSANLLNFVGHIEFYAPLLFLFTLYLHRLREACAGRRSPGAAAALWGVAYLFHKMMIIFAPTLGGILLTRSAAGKLWPPRFSQTAAQPMMWIIGAIILDTAISATGFGAFGTLIIHREDKIYELITPPTVAFANWVTANSQTGVFFWYELGRPLHWAYFFGFLFAGAPVGLWAAWRGRRVLRSIDADWILVGAAIGVIWLFFWHPHMGWKDWDLMCIALVPLNFAAGLAWSATARRQREQIENGDNVPAETLAA